jgi:hypothetical protein
MGIGEKVIKPDGRMKGMTSVLQSQQGRAAAVRCRTYSALALPEWRG